ncbi:MAG: GNAT family N-acetyltransferase [Acidilobaceae archaeon]|nr:GNAT family N-acetyltransferase [Acidilobaceae archaeon]
MYELGVIVRRPSEEEARELARLILRFYLFNEEFDRAMEVTRGAEEIALKVAQERIRSDNVLLVATMNDRLVGYVYGYVLENPILVRREIGVLKELYVAPGYRGMGIARALVEHASKELTNRGVRYIAAEFPSMNVVAEKFYEKLGFRRFLSIYLREV